MSFVGPRPFPRYHLEQFSAEFLSLRRSVPPGLTGLWQVSARGNGDLAVQETLDTQYIRQWSLLVDIRLIAHTVLVVLSQQGAY
jgi:lipopolysaccharide/colanic/teichoic acid biosynthesis glycosyltransferase